MKNSGFLCLTLLAAFLTGCASTSPKFPDAGTLPSVTVNNSVDPDLLKPPTDLFVLGPGDQVDIEITGNAASRTTVTVGMDGKIYFSMLPGFDVWGLTLVQARERIDQALSKYVNQHSVSLSLRSVGSKSVWLLGRMNKPGIYPLTGPTTLLDAIALAGGTAQSASTVGTLDLADLRHSFVTRQGKLLPVNFVTLLQDGDMSQNIYLQPDDFVFIPSSLSQEVYVLGAVVSPRTVPFSYPMTIISAISGANGPADEAYLSHVAIVRGTLSQPQLIELNYKDIIHGKAPNVALEPGDIVYVPLSPYRFVTEYAKLIVTTFAQTWTANEGVRAVLGNQNSLGVNVPIGPH